MKRRLIKSANIEKMFKRKGMNTEKKIERKDKRQLGNKWIILIKNWVIQMH